MVYFPSYQLGGVNVVIEISDNLKKFLRRIPMNLLNELDSIIQEIPYSYVYDENGEEGLDWRKIDELSRQISYAYREGNNPEKIRILEPEDHNVLFGMALTYANNQKGEVYDTAHKILKKIMEKYG